MIFCPACRRLWPKGTAYCGSCGASLGKRFCPDGHENRLDVQACTTCGSRKLTRGSRGIQLRPLGWLLGLGIAWLVWRWCAVPLLHILWDGLAHIVLTALRALMPLL